MCNLHWCYTWTALLLANQNRVIFLMCIIISKTEFFTPWSLPETVQCNLNLLVSDSSILTGEVNKVAIISSQT